MPLRYKILGAAVAAAAAVTMLSLWLTGVFSSAPVNPLCTPQAAASSNAYWQEQINEASYVDLQATIAEAIAATSERLNYCKAHGG
jgi:hypothetical protein